MEFRSLRGRFGAMEWVQSELKESFRGKVAQPVLEKLLAQAADADALSLNLARNRSARASD